MEITIVNETKAVAKYNVNFEAVKEHLTNELKKYDQLCITDEYIQSAKKSRAELNAMKKDLASKLSEIRKQQLAPYEALKDNYTNELEQMIDEKLVKIDTAIKEIERQKAEQKEKEIKNYFNEKNIASNLDVKYEKVANAKWTNISYSISKVKAEIDVFFDKVVADLDVIENFDDEFVIPLKKLYMSCFDMSAVMRNKQEFDKEKEKRLQAEAEAERLRQELNKQTEAEIVTDEICEVKEQPKGNISNQQEKCEETQSDVANVTNDEIPEQKNEQQYEIIKFWVKVTPEQKLLMRNFVINNNIQCGKIKD